MLRHPVTLPISAGSGFHRSITGLKHGQFGVCDMPVIDKHNDDFTGHYFWVWEESPEHWEAHFHAHNREHLFGEYDGIHSHWTAAPRVAYEEDHGG